MAKQILVVAAHPDDEVLGCGGTIARLSGEGHTVHIAILGEGITSRGDQPDNPGQLKALADHCAAAGRIMGTENPHLFDLPDNRFDTVPLLDIVKEIEVLLEKVKPDTIFTHHPGDLNIDHVITSRAVLTAARPLPRHPVRDIYLFEIPSSTEWGFHQTGPAFKPNLFFNIGAQLPIKLEALQAYEGEIRPFPHPRSEKAVIAAAQRWGSCVGHTAAEPFEVARIVYA